MFLSPPTIKWIAYFGPEHNLGNVRQGRRMFSILHYTGQQFIQYSVCRQTHREMKKLPCGVLTCPSIGCFFLPREAIIAQAEALHGLLSPCPVSIYVLTLNILLGSIAGDQNTLFTCSIHRIYRPLSLLHAGNQ